MNVQRVGLLFRHPGRSPGLGAREPLGVGRRSVRVKLATLAGITASLTALTSAASTASARTAHHPTGAIETCATQSGAGFPHAFTSHDNLVVAPLTLIGAGTFTDAKTVKEFGGNKFPLLVAAGHTVTIEVTSRQASLAYGSHSRKGHRVMTFRSCDRKHAASTADGRPVTFWSGFVQTTHPACIALRIWIDRDRTPRQRHIALGKRC
jgi:hypothetical protein